ncbi:hypothetical protein [Microbacterium sp. 179-I 3D3 NHS]|uniref:hypothetical protein n=1 Tax=unclassified Microbacterium TaxID=2609290 RepID=UPI00399FD414
MAVEIARRIDERQRMLGGVELLTMRGTSAEVAIDTAATHPDHAVIAFIEADALWTRNGDAPWRRAESGLVIAAPGISRDLRGEGDWLVTAALLPRSAVATFASPFPDEPQLFTDRRLLDLAMERFIDGVLGVEIPATEIEQRALEHMVIDLGGAIVRDRVGEIASRVSSRAALRDRAVGFIAQQCSDPDLAPVDVANAVESSLRLLQVVFAEAGNTVAGEIRRQRARLARSLLVDSRFDELGLELIAQLSGFRSSMSLRRALEDVYQTTPRALRAERPA